jgi:hypothetical protein
MKWKNDKTLEICGWRLDSIVNPSLQIKLKGVAITMHTTKAYEGIEVQFCIFLNLSSRWR